MIHFDPLHKRFHTFSIHTVTMVFFDPSHIQNVLFLSQFSFLATFLLLILTLTKVFINVVMWYTSLQWPCLQICPAEDLSFSWQLNSFLILCRFISPEKLVGHENEFLIFLLLQAAPTSAHLANDPTACSLQLLPFLDGLLVLSFGAKHCNLKNCLKEHIFPEQ